ncbi:coiled-coil domain-containing protein 190 [Carlito syrichta]|uniref:Coiled-coil domain-containing protein 190 n=1 Tax=Carlito syrichta TaxID=1868482 RepID=A0A1U7UCN5_CARSF|nr:coiled-coil domain-containing protein 190 [Carlito syrichta]
MERHMVRGPLHKHFDLERKNAKQTEARLGQRLQKLEDICLYQMKLLTWEQKQLQSELQRLQQADIMKKKSSSYFGSGIQKRPDDIFMFSPQRRQKNREPWANNIRALATNMAEKIYKTKSKVPPLHHIAPKDPTKSKKQLLSQNHRTACVMEEKPQAQEKDSTNSPKGMSFNKGISVLHQDQEVSANNTEQGPSYSPSGDSRMVYADETRSKGATLKPDWNAGKQIPPNLVEGTESFKGEFTQPTFLELFAKAKNAHYLRHRVPPESERLLSIREIFGHGEPSSPRA